MAIDLSTWLGPIVSGHALPDNAMSGRQPAPGAGPGFRGERAGSGALNWALMEVAEPNTTYGPTRDGSARFNGIRLAPLVPVPGGGSVGLPGDSGGPAWGTETEPPGVVGIQRLRRDRASFHARAADVRDWARDQIVSRSSFPSFIGSDFSASDSAAAA